VVVETAHRFGVLPAENAVERTCATRLRPHTLSVVEALTIYTPPTLSDCTRGTAAGSRPRTRREQPRPFALATADGRSAVAMFSPAAAATRAIRGFSTAWWASERGVPPAGEYAPGPHDYRLAWAVGTLEEVRAALAACLRGGSGLASSALARPAVRSMVGGDEEEAVVTPGSEPHASRRRRPCWRC
jgi:hypothetical protein